ncbi:MAG: DUF4395 family protein [Gammaproteobacteria bacterium]
MAKHCDLSFQQKSLFQQGFQSYTPAELKQLEWGLRFTPAVCSLIALYGLIYQLPVVLYAVASLGLIAFFLPKSHPMDLIYNHGVRHLFGAVALPTSPFQRRLACMSAGIMNIIAASLFLLNLPVAAFIVGGMLLALQAIVIFTHFCTLSWMYEGMMRLLGKWSKPLEVEKAKKLLNSGAVIIDVRGPDEFSSKHLIDAINMPLEELENLAHKLQNMTALLYCNSGTRSHIGTQKLLKAGLTQVYDIGDFGRAEMISQSA